MDFWDLNVILYVRANPRLLQSILELYLHRRLHYLQPFSFPLVRKDIQARARSPLRQKYLFRLL